MEIVGSDLKEDGNPPAVVGLNCTAFDWEGGSGVWGRERRVDTMGGVVDRSDNEFGPLTHSVD